MFRYNIYNNIYEYKVNIYKVNVYVYIYIYE